MYTNPQHPELIVAFRWRAVYKYYYFIIRGDFSCSEIMKSWNVSYKGVVIHAYFYMTVTNNKVTNAWDYSITTLGSTYSDASLTYNSSLAKLTFTSNAYNGIASHTCWLKGTPRGTNNEVDVTYSM